MAQTFYSCSANRRPTGGNKITYRHVEILRELDVDAFVAHPLPDCHDDTINHVPAVVCVKGHGMNQQ